MKQAGFCFLFNEVEPKKGGIDLDVSRWGLLMLKNLDKFYFEI